MLPSNFVNIVEDYILFIPKLMIFNIKTICNIICTDCHLTIIRGRSTHDFDGQLFYWVFTIESKPVGMLTGLLLLVLLMEGLEFRGSLISSWLKALLDDHFLWGTRMDAIAIVEESSSFCLCSFTSECSSDTSRCTKKQINCQETQYPIIISKI